jgi:hypothetical protein
VAQEDDNVASARRRSTLDGRVVNKHVRETWTSGLMQSTTAFTHRGYLLNCAPARASDGSFKPYVVISRSSDGELVANRFFPSDLHFNDEDAAIVHARDWAVRWIDASSLTI